MFKSPEQMVNEYKEEMRGGKGTVELLHIFQQDELKGKCRIFAKITMNPGCSIGLHPHENEEEVYYILSGTGTVNDNGNIKEVKVGDAVLTGGGAQHSIENTGDQPLVLMAVVLLY
ncbi:cupin domain-containing protein [Petroclostridium sp. X23]|uniref:cupin domain-containing protein n=1 Tax=Petroclostridium sp. X23 TaxID=3045146 RepID=UPI0024ADFDB1|nr:cupin domain-containing protein [Petroclostridium sp. X23]WHH61035.1 cupin domain-containing protein [Petroclostridium sp. X23]